jgi:pimeloyl-ACP methyl ester carboxylesterase
MFAPQVAALGGSAHALDYPGFGGRAARPGMTLDDYALDIREEWQRRGIGRAVVVGFSLGAQIALLVARDAPELVDGLVLSSTQGEAPADEERGMFNQIADAAEAHGPAALLDNFLGLMLGETTHDKRPEVVERVRALILEATPEGLATGCRALAARSDPAPVAAAVSAPALLVYGAEDKAVPVEQGRALADSLAGARFEVADGAGHFCNLETPDRYGQLLSTFLESLGT